MPTDYVGNLAISLFSLKALIECIGGALLGLIIAPFLREKPKLRFQPTPQNRQLVDRCPALQSFAASPWAPGAISQTVLGLAVQVGTPEYQRREVVVAPDGVELLLDFKEGPNTPEDAPLMVILHGIGGNSDSRLARLLADACVEQGWRAVVYNRRGHGESTLMPAPLVQPQPQPSGTNTDKVLYKVEKAAIEVTSGIAYLPQSLTMKATQVAKKMSKMSTLLDGQGTHVSDDEDTAYVGCIPGSLFSQALASRPKHQNGDGSKIHSRRTTQDGGSEQPSRSTTQDGGSERVSRKVAQEGGGANLKSITQIGVVCEDSSAALRTPGPTPTFIPPQSSPRSPANASLPANGHERCNQQVTSHSVQKGQKGDGGIDGLEGAQGAVNQGAAQDSSICQSTSDALFMPTPPRAPETPSSSPQPPSSSPGLQAISQQQQPQQRQQPQPLATQQHSSSRSDHELQHPEEKVRNDSIVLDVGEMGGPGDRDHSAGQHRKAAKSNKATKDCNPVDRGHRGREQGAPGQMNGGALPEDGRTHSTCTTSVLGMPEGQDQGCKPGTGGGVGGGSVTIDIAAEAHTNCGSSRGPCRGFLDRAEELTRSKALKNVTKVFPAHSNTDDLAVVSAYLAQKYPKSVRLILGFSQGSNLLVHYLGLHAADPPPYAAAICVSNAFDLEIGTQLLSSRRPLASAIMAHEIRRLLIKEMAAVQELCQARGIKADIDTAMRCTCIREFDNALLVPSYGFQNVDEYYRQQSSGHVLPDVVTPLLCLNNDDDPFIPDKLPDAAGDIAVNGPRANVIAARTKRGGHLGWLQGWSGDSWMREVMLQFSKAVLVLVAQGTMPLIPQALRRESL